MPFDEVCSYPGTHATPGEILGLANGYRRSALALLAPGRDHDRFSRAPGELCAIHAIELYFNAYLRATGDSPERVRALMHNLGERSRVAAQRGLVLRRRTLAHLARMTEERDYIVLRYGPERLPGGVPLNRMTATLTEVGEKVNRAPALRSAPVPAALTQNQDSFRL